MQEEDSSSLNVNLFITGITSKEAYTEVSISNGASFFISCQFFLERHLAKGLPVSPELCSDMEKEQAFMLCSRKAVDLLSKCEHSAFTLRMKLLQRGFSPDIINCVISSMKEKKYLDDKRYGELWVVSRMRKNPCGQSVLMAGLMAKGLSSQDSMSVLSQFDEKFFFDGAVRAYKKLRHNKKNINEKIIRQLLQKGFSMREVRKVLETENEKEE